MSEGTWRHYDTVKALVSYELNQSPYLKID